MKKQIENQNAGRAWMTAVMLLAGTGAAWSQTAAAPVVAPPKTGWEAWEKSAAVAVTLARGNSESFLGTLSLDAKRRWAKDELAFVASAGYGEIAKKTHDASGNVISKDNQTSTEFAQASAQYNRLFSEKFYGGLRADAVTDDIADLDYRIKVSPIAGYYVVKTDRTKLSFEGGPSFVWEHYSPKHQATQGDSFIGIRLGERFEHKLSETTKIWQSLEYLARVDRWSEKYLITGEVGIDTAISKKWSLRLVFQDVYDSQPAPYLEKNDMRLLAGTAYKF